MHLVVGGREKREFPFFGECLNCGRTPFSRKLFPGGFVVGEERSLDSMYLFIPECAITKSRCQEMIDDDDSLHPCGSGFHSQPL